MGPIDTSSDVHFLIFVDVDGVLNIGARDPGQPPLIFSDANVKRAFEFLDSSCKQRGPARSVETLLSIYDREPGNGEKTKYSEYMSSGETSLCKPFVQRLARIIQEARAQGKLTVVLSSSWRQPRYVRHVRVLEDQLSQALGRPFTFDERTPVGNDKAKQGRVDTISDYLISFRRRNGAQAEKLRALILEDFCITNVDSPESIEHLLCQSASGPGEDVDVEVCLIHTYDTWTAPNGNSVEIGCGLTEHHFSRALDFLRKDHSQKTKPIVLNSTAKDILATQDLSKRGSPWLVNTVGFLKVMAGFVCYTHGGPGSPTSPQTLRQNEPIQVSL